MAPKVYGLCRCGVLSLLCNLKNTHRPTLKLKTLSTWAYRCSVAVRVQETYAIGYNVPCACFCTHIAPKPYEDASADTTVGDFGWNKASNGVEMSICLRLSKVYCFIIPHTQWFSLMSKSLKDFVLSARCGTNLLRWFTMPKNWRNSEAFLGVGIVWIARILAGSTLIPVSSISCPRNKIFHWEN